MKAEELMIGDWVQSDRLIEPKAAKYSGHFSHYTPAKGKPYTRLELMYNPNCGSQIPEDDVKPIPLTEEILKKNHFKWIKTWEAWCIFAENGGSIMLMKIEDSFCVSGTNIPCSYVHELQHILRLVRLNEVADNFKVLEERV